MPFRIFCLLITLLPAFSFGQRAIRPNEQINSSCEEREPIPSPDGQMVYFWRRECPENTGGHRDPGDIWYSRRDARGQWSTAQRFGLPLNSKGHEFVWQVSAKHDTLFLVQVAPGVQEAGISYSVRERNSQQWSSPVPMHIRDFRYEGSYKDYFRTPQNVLLLPNEGFPSFGGTDLYACFPINDTAWSKPINLGPDINTQGNEDAPFMAPDGRTLYFNTDGGSEGQNSDIYMSYRLDDTWQRWSLPVRLPAPVNSPGADFDFQISADGKTAWWCSNLGTLGNNDIFYMDLSACEVDVYPGGDLTYCVGSSVQLEAGFTTKASVSFQWMKNGSPIRGGNAATLRVESDGDYQLLRSSPGCEALSPVQRIRFVSPPSALVETAGGADCLEDSLVLVARGNASSFQWFKNGLKIPEATDARYLAHSPGNYQVEAAIGSCSAKSPTFDLLPFTPPIIFTKEDSIRGWLPILPRWQWTNKLRAEKGKTYFADLVTGPRGEIYAITQTENRGRVHQRISSLFSHGLERSIVYDKEVKGVKPTFLATDPEGNLVVAGENEYLRKFHPDGRVMWWKDEQRQHLMGLCTDPLGNIYTAGRYRDSLQVGSELLSAPDRGAIFLAKHSPRGELLWVKSFATDSYRADFGNALASDCEGNVYLAGGFDLVADFGSYSLRSTLLKENYFLAKFGPEGEVIYARKINTERTRVRSGDLYVECQGPITLLLNREYFTFASNGIDLWNGPLLMPEGSYAVSHRVVSEQGDAYVSGLTADGRYFVTKLNRMYNQIILWQDRGAAFSEQDLPAIAVDRQGSIIVAGISTGNGFQGDRFDLTNGSSTFLMKYGRPMVEAVAREPLSLCDGQAVVLLVREEPGLSYQWVKDGREISGATLPAYRATRAGTYQVKAVLGNCVRVSEPQAVSECGQAPPPLTVASLLPEPVPTTPQPEPARLSVPSEVNYGMNGTPRSLRGRRVKTQDEVTVSSQQATILVWDHGAVDNDTVSVNLNGQWLLQEYGLKKEPYELQVTLQPGDNFLMLFAHNLGTIPPNTASIKIDDGKKPKTLQLRSNLRNCGMLKIRVEP